MVKERIVRTDEIQNAVFQDFGDAQISMLTVGNGNTIILTRENVIPKRQPAMTLEEAFGTLPGLVDGFERDESDRF